MSLKFERGDLGDLDTLYNLIENYSQQEMKDRTQLELLLSKEEYNLLFAVNENGRLVGYALFLQTEDYIWLDFVSVLDNYQDKSYGTQILKKVMDMSSDLDLGIFLEVTTPDGDDFNEELEVLEWVEHAGLVRLPVPYKLASEFADTKAYLYFGPSRHVRHLTGRTIEKVIEHSLTEIHSDVFTIEDTIDYLKGEIDNGKVYFKKEKSRTGLMGIIFGLGNN